MKDDDLGGLTPMQAGAPRPKEHGFEAQPRAEARMAEADERRYR